MSLPEENSLPSFVFRSLNLASRFFSVIFLLYFQFVMLSSLGHAQILDDSTKQVYGPKTTNYVLEEDFLYNRYKRVNTDSSWSIMGAKYSIDTSLNDLHNYTFLFRNSKPYQDLGNIGTPIQPIFFEPQRQIGKVLGFNAFSAYAIDPLKIKYMDTKSPYTHLVYVQSSKGQQVLDVEHSRNIKANWNMGFIFRRQTSQKIVGSLNPINTSSNKKPQASHWSFAFYTRYYTKNERYQILFNFTHLHHTNYDIGGVISKNYDSLFYAKEEKVGLYAARSIDKRENYHLYHEYSIDKRKTIQLYHMADFNKRLNRFNDLTSASSIINSLDSAYYASNAFGRIKGREFGFSNKLMDDLTSYQMLENRAGVKGNFGNLSYNFYYKNRDLLKYSQPSYNRSKIPWSDSTRKNPDPNPVNRKFTEDFLGAGIGYFLKDSSYLKAEAEYLIYGITSDNVKTLHDYRLNIEYFYKYFRFGVNRQVYSPTLVQQQYRSNLAAWDNIHSDSTDFKQTTADQAFAGLTVKLPWLQVSPKLTYDRVKDWIYYDTVAVPRQNSKTLNIISAELDLSLVVKNIHLEVFGKYTYSDGYPEQLDDKKLMFPKLVNRNRLYFQGFLFHKAILLQVGADAYFRSSYYGNKYMPVTQQFYLNNNFELKKYFLVDVFLNAQIKSFRIFLRLSHVNQLRKKGYYITPYYQGLPRTFDIGLNWRFYN